MTQIDEGVLNAYNYHRNELQNMQKTFDRPLKMHVVFWLINILIIGFITAFGFYNAKQQYDLLAEQFISTMFSFSFSLGVCGIVSLLQKIYYYFARKTSKKLIPDLIRKHEEILLLKFLLIDNIQRCKDYPLFRPHGNCANPQKLQRRWKEQEHYLHEINLLEVEDRFSRMSAKSFMWFVLAVGVAVTSVLLVIAIYLAAAICLVLVFFALLAAYFLPPDKPSFYPSRGLSHSSDNKYNDLHFCYKEPEEEKKKDMIKKAKKKTLSKIAEIKNDLSLWGYMVSHI